MTIALVVISLLLVISVVMNVLLFKVARRLSDFAVRFEKSIDEALDTLDELYKQLSHTLEVPVLVDDPLTRRVLDQLRRCRDEILRIAGKISLQETPEADERTDDEE